MTSDRTPLSALGTWVPANKTLLACAFIFVALLLRLRTAWGTFLNPDEALHFRLANKASWTLTYQASLTNAHPPLLTFVLHAMRTFGSSEFVLRLPSVIAGTAFCWVFYQWLTRVLGSNAALIGLLFAAFLPPLVSISAEVRQYALLLFFLASCAYLLEDAFDRKSPRLMLLSALFLCLGMLTHYSAILFAVSIGGYALLHFAKGKYSAQLITGWALGQACALGLVIFLYQTHISRYRGSNPDDLTANGWAGIYLKNSYFHSGRDHLLVFIFARSFGIFQFLFGQLAVGDIAALIFVAGIVFLWRQTREANSAERKLSLLALLILPFIIGCAAAIVGKYPYGGTRHSVYLSIFAIAGISLALCKLETRKLHGLLLAALMIAFCYLFPQPHRPYLLRADQNRKQMDAAITYIQQHVSTNDVIFVDYQSSLLFGHYLCHQQPISFNDSVLGFESFTCDGRRIISSNSATWMFTAETFPDFYQRMVSNFHLHSGVRVWVAQAGWNIGLAEELKRKLPEFHDLQASSWGRNIQLFEITECYPCGRRSDEQHRKEHG
ncbi:MAG: glycosyltransferase family 39 protein [Acidobacteriota bacterium]|nr:glycosyltransferase family 39 protein [Acidobacteriota bacterium]